jgi:hypothetical protein
VIVKGAKEFNIPLIRANRKLVASVNGGLHNPSSLVFNPEWDNEQPQRISKRFNYPSISGTKRPESEEDIAFMSVSFCCGAHLSSPHPRDLPHYFPSSCLIYNFLLLVHQVLELGELIKTKQITSEELTHIFLQRLKR